MVVILSQARNDQRALAIKRASSEEGNDSLTRHDLTASLSKEEVTFCATLGVRNINRIIPANGHRPYRSFFVVYVPQSNKLAK